MPLIIPLRLLNTVMLVVAAVVFLLECRQLIRAPGVLSLILVVLAVVVAIRAFKLLQTREGVAVIGATREYYNRLQGAILSSNPDYAQYRSQRGNVLVREAYKHPRTSGPAASVLLADMRRYRVSGVGARVGRQTSAASTLAVLLASVLLGSLFVVVPEAHAQALPQIVVSEIHYHPQAFDAAFPD